MNNDDLHIPEQLEKLFSKAANFSMSAEEKTLMRERLDAYSGETAPLSPVPLPVRSRWVFFSARSITTAALALFLIVGVGITQAAIGTLPGDALYPVKIHVDEKIAALFSFGPKATAEVLSDQAVNRLSEIENLAVIGKLDPATASQESARFSAAAVAVNSQIETLQKKGDTENAALVSSDFESALAAHHDILIQLSQSKSNMEGVLADVALTVDGHLSQAATIRTANESLIATSTDVAVVKASATAALQSSEDQIQTTKQYLNTIAPTLKNHAVASSDLAVAETYADLGKSKLQAGAYGDAFILFNKAHRTAEGAHLKLQSENELAALSHGDLFAGGTSSPAGGGVAAAAKISSSTAATSTGTATGVMLMSATVSSTSENATTSATTTISTATTTTIEGTSTISASTTLEIQLKNSNR